MPWPYQGPNLYSTARWQKLRMSIIARDAAVCQMCRCLTTTGRHDPRSAEVDHKLPHKGDAKLFFDPENVWTLCKRCHATDKQAIERGGAAKLRREDGW